MFTVRLQQSACDRFIDEDLDPVDLGGFIAWTPPVSLQRVTFYHVDLATETLAPTSAERSQIGDPGSVASCS